MYNNINGIKTKIPSLKRIVSEEKPVILALTETKLKESDTFSLDGYVVKRLDRKTEGGGILIAYKECLKNITLTVREEVKEVEMMWVKIDNGKRKWRIGIIYMPQENTMTINKLKKVYSMIKEEVVKAQAQNEKVMLMGDLNCKVGDIIANNSTVVSKGGKVLKTFCSEMGLIITNSMNICEGTWTRMSRDKKSVLDYIIVNQEVTAEVEKVSIDEDKIITPYHVVGKEVIYSDHCMMTIVHKDNYKNNQKPKKYISERGYQKLQQITKERKLSCIIQENSFDESYTKWSEQILHEVEECNKKRKKSKGWKVERKWNEVKKAIKQKLRNKNLSEDELKIGRLRRDLVNENIEKESRYKHHTHINSIVDNIKKEGGVNSTSFWELKQKIERKHDESGHKIENEDGIITEDREEILNVYSNFYTKLLETTAGDTEIARECEEINKIVISALTVIAQAQSPENILEEDLNNVIKDLKNKKAQDMSKWRNEYIKNGGDEMVKSLMKIISIIDQSLDVPTNWNKMKIKSIHKKGSKEKMENKRGLFITDLISKLYERLIKIRNSTSFKFSQMQSGGVKGRSTIDNVMIILALIERNTYLGKTTYLTFADAVKCFDNLWLDDGIKDLWKCGMSVRDCISIRNMNRKAVAIVETPVGVTKEIVVEDIVRQGTVSGPAICGASMDQVNTIGYKVATHYGPNIEINILAFVDDLVSGGSQKTANKTITNCQMMEEKKKFLFNTKKGKSGILVIGRNDNDTITAQVKSGSFLRVDEHQILGTWFDKTAKYKINIMKKQEKVPFMAAYIKRVASTYTMGNMAVAARLKLMEVVSMPSIFYNAEVYPNLTNEETEIVERIQGKILRKILELPKTTPYYPLLLETGVLTVEAKIHYKKLMLFHNIMHSDDSRIIKRILRYQMTEETRKGTWMNSIETLLKKYDIKEKVDVIKPTWKKLVKEKIRTVTETTIRSKCKKKGRTAKLGKYEQKEYMKSTTVEQCKNILLLKLHMTNIPCNYEAGESTCWLCGESNASTEHYFSCKEVKNIWNVKAENLASEKTSELLRASSLLESVSRRNVLSTFGKKLW